MEASRRNMESAGSAGGSRCGSEERCAGRKCQCAQHPLFDPAGAAAVASAFIVIVIGGLVTGVSGTLGIDWYAPLRRFVESFGLPEDSTMLVIMALPFLLGVPIYFALRRFVPLYRAAKK
jgi:hypothetical protein